MFAQTDEFYVGYLPAPAGQRRFIAWVVVVAAVMIAGVAAVVASFQADPGHGRWDYGRVEEFEGTLAMRPYPLLRETGGKTWLLVGQGKVGIGEAYRRFGAMPVKVRATRVDRGELRILELAEGEAVREIPAKSAEPSPRPSPGVPGEGERGSQISNLRFQRGEVVLRGEIVDPKCFGGAMKPGAGKAHKGCATLCIRGGIPPVFVAEDGRVYVLVDGKGDGLAGEGLEEIVPYMADRVEVRGRVEWDGDIALLRLDLASLRRL